MAVHFVTGKLGGGKTLVSVGRIKDYLLEGKKVATNLDLNLEYLLPRSDKKCRVFRIPDKPKLVDLEAIGVGTSSRRDEDFGLLVLDELGTWLNSRTYQKDQDRQSVIDWFLHARKLGWDVLLIVQDIDLIDKQVRIALAEHVCICRRTDRIPLPFVGFFFKMITGSPIRLPRVHIGTVFYGTGQSAIKVDNWVYRGNCLFKAYDTAQIFENNENRVSTFIPPAYLNNKRFSVKNKRFYMRLTKVYFKRFKTPAAFLLGVVLNFILLAGFVFYNNPASASLPDDPPAPPTEQKLSMLKFNTVRLSVIRTFKSGQIGELVIFDDELIPLKDFPHEYERRGTGIIAYLPAKPAKKASLFNQGSSEMKQ